MARQTGSNNFAGTLEVQAGGPLDARSVVHTKADLTASGNFPYSYIGMQVAVQSEGKAYMLTGADPTVAANWKAVGSDIQIDSVPTAESPNAVSSGGVYASLAGKVNTNDVGVASGIAELDANGKVPASQLPSYVDDVIEGYYKVADGKFYEESTYTTEITGEDGKIYISVDSDIQYRWTGSAFSALGGALTLGETSSTAYRGDRGKAAYDFSTDPYTSDPAMNGTAAAGSSAKWAKGDHVHPSDISKVDVSKLAVEFNWSTTYTAGQYVYYQGKVYKWIKGRSGGSQYYPDNPEYSVEVSDIMNTKQEKLNFDSTPTENSRNPVTSGGVFAALAGLSNSFDDLTNRPVQGETAISSLITPLPGYKTWGTKYSTSEQVVGEWIDGKPLYQKTIDCGGLKTKTVSHGISNLKRVIDIEGYTYAYTNNQLYIWPLPGFDNLSNAKASVTVEGDFISLVSNPADFSSIYTETYITLRYTKTTD